MSSLPIHAQHQAKSIELEITADDTHVYVMRRGRTDTVPFLRLSHEAAARLSSDLLRTLNHERDPSSDRPRAPTQGS